MKTLEEIARAASILNKEPVAEWMRINGPLVEQAQVRTDGVIRIENTEQQGHFAQQLIEAENRLIATACVVAMNPARSRDGFEIEPLLPERKGWFSRSEQPAVIDQMNNPPRYKDAELRAAAAAFSHAVNRQLERKKVGGSTFELPDGILVDPAQYVVDSVKELVGHDQQLNHAARVVRNGNGRAVSARG